MSFPSYCDQARPSEQASARTGSIVRRIWHHQAGTNDDATINAMVSGSKEVSANQTVDNKPPATNPQRKHARITGVVHTEQRAWTSSSSVADGRAMTAEVANSSGPPSYGISEATYAACAIMAAGDFLDLGIPLKRATRDDPTGHLGHAEVLGMFGQGYPTACPLHLDIDRIIADAKSIIAGAQIAPVKGNQDMFLGQHPSGAVTYFGEFTKDGVTAGEFQYLLPACGNTFVKMTDEGYRQELINVDLRVASFRAAMFDRKLTEDEKAALAQTTVVGIDEWLKKHSDRTDDVVAKVAELETAGRAVGIAS